MESVLKPLCETKEYAGLMSALKNGVSPVEMTGLIDPAKSQLVAAAACEKKYKIIVTYDEAKAREIVADMKLYDRETVYYPAKDLIFFSADVRGQAITKERLALIRRLTSDIPTTIVTTIDGGMDMCLPYKYYQKYVKDIKVGETIDIPEFTALMTDMGYENVAEVTREGEYSIRGGIVDVFPMTEETAYRIELWDDEIDNIRRIDVESQRSVEKVDGFRIPPATEVMLNEDQIAAGMHRIKQESEELIREYKKNKNNAAAARLKDVIENFKNSFELYHGMVNLESYIKYFIDEKPVSFFDYFSGKDAIVFIDDPARVEERAEAIEAEFRDNMKRRLEEGYILPAQADILFSATKVTEKLLGFQTVYMSLLQGGLSGYKAKEVFTVDVRKAPSYNNNFIMLCKDLKKYSKDGYRVLVVSASATRARRMCDDLQDYDVLAFFSEDSDREIKPGEVMLVKGNLRNGFEYSGRKYIVFTEGDIFGTRRKRKKTKKYTGNSIHSFNDLKVGDYVVHEEHGLGIYEGIEKIETDHVIKDYLKVSYAAGSSLYVPATSLEVLQKYADSDAKPPKLNRLGSPEWKKTKSKVRAAVDEIAQELVDLYAIRRKKRGFIFDADTVWQKEFEELFPYDETEDQLRAIEQTKSDMESDRIMDRLICGDVGYGKTEIAIRAVFKAVMSGKQAAVLVPTTILASQHYQTFVDRMKKFGVGIGLLCRLRTKAEQKKVIEGLKKGTVDVVIGTHSMLSDSVEFKNLGLLVIDEEQRFGVRHKEKIKQLKNDIDVLTLSATPIPRTLHMSLIGIRDMSVLEEAPVDRMPIQTFVMEMSDQIAREAIMREIKRGGQVYYIYNRVNTIETVAGRLAKTVPEARVAYAHGQMSERQLEDTMYRFIEGDIDVLVATTIVESGLDIPNVNTIIVEDADRLGLSQLYQLRGRVGRSGRSSYAFMMYKRDKVLKEVTEKRLAAIREFTDLGSGFRISMRDLELRGAGNILGTGQHGHMAAVGYDLYCKMLDNAIRRLKGEEIPDEEFETSVDIKVDAFIPPEYISNEFQKLDIYKRIAEVETDAEREDMLDELNDRFREPPKCVLNLLDITLIRRRAHAAYITSIEELGDDYILKMYREAKVDPTRIPELIIQEKGNLKFVPERSIVRRGKEVKLDPYFCYRKEGNPLDRISYAVGLIEKIVVKESVEVDDE
ncbi:MAG: transcription-repair coupling factor [Eubacterium sp.]|nr:transcription-repair coupling factor [Eubacterium sp.]